MITEKKKVKKAQPKKYKWNEKWAANRRLRYATDEAARQTVRGRSNAYREKVQAARLLEDRNTWLKTVKSPISAKDPVCWSLRNRNGYTLTIDCKESKGKVVLISPQDLGIRLGLSGNTFVGLARNYGFPIPLAKIANQHGKPSAFYTLEQANKILGAMRETYLVDKRGLSPLLLDSLRKL